MMPHSTGEPLEGGSETVPQPTNGEHQANRSDSTQDPTKEAPGEPTQDAPKTPEPTPANAGQEEEVNGKGASNDMDIHEPDAESELSEPGSVIQSPPNLADEIVVSDRAGGDHQDSSKGHDASEDEDETMVDAQSEGPVVSPYPKRKRTAIGFDGASAPESEPDLPGTKSESNAAPSNDRPKSAEKEKPSSANPTTRKGAVTVGHWRESPIPDQDRKHAVIGFIDVRDRLRTRIQGWNLKGEQVSNTWPLPMRTGASWVTFDGIHFLPHLVGLDQLQVKEYVRLRLNAPEETEEERIAAEKEAVQEAIRIVREAASADTSTHIVPQPPIAYGAEVPEAKRRRISGGFTPTQHTPSAETVLDPLPGTRPTRILLGAWSKSEADTRKDRHAVYGILGHNDMFRVKLVRETRDGTYKDGNFPQGAGALWIPYEEVDFDTHLKHLTRQEIKEYCRVRQWQLDRGEHHKDRIANETKAVYDAQTRVGASNGYANLTPASYSSPARAEDSPTQEQSSSRAAFGGQELRSSRRVEAMAMAKNQQQQQKQQQQQQSQPQQDRSEHLNGRGPFTEIESRPTSHNQGLGPLQRTSALAQREISRAEATQGRADQHSRHRKRAAAAADAATAAAAASVPPPRRVEGAPVHESEDMRRLNNVWAHQESMRASAVGEDSKIYDGVKYERKVTGPLMGRLVSPGNIINIDGEDFVEYRVLTKPAFF